MEDLGMGIAVLVIGSIIISYLLGSLFGKPDK